MTIKTTILIITLTFFKISFGQILEGKVIYKASLYTDTYIKELKSNTEIPEYRKRLKIQDALDARPMNFFLLFKGNESLYHAEFDLDQQRDMGLGFNLLGSVAGVFYTSYISIETKENFRQNFWMDNVVINLKPLVWKLTKETKKIGKYTCYKATSILKEEREQGGFTSNQIIAWYTPQIPVGFGVQNFGGLPGLTLQLTQYTESGILFYKATKIELNPKEKIIIKKPKGEEITHKEFIELTRR